jgi:hypothetical protein
MISAKGQSTLPLYQLFKPHLIQYDTTTISKLNLNKILQVYHVNQQPIFCKWEELWTRSSKINLRLRLGSVQYVDELEKNKP